MVPCLLIDNEKTIYHIFNFFSYSIVKIIFFRLIFFHEKHINDASTIVSFKYLSRSDLMGLCVFLFSELF